MEVDLITSAPGIHTLRRPKIPHTTRTYYHSIYICTTEKGDSNTYTSCLNKLVIEAMTFLSKKPLLFFIIILAESTLAVLASSSSTVLPSPEGNNNSMVNITQKFEEWIVENGRVYSGSSEKARRFEMFKATLQRMEEENKRSGRPNRYFLHPFSDFNPNESRSCVDMELEKEWEEEELVRTKTRLGQYVYTLRKRKIVLN